MSEKIALEDETANHEDDSTFDNTITGSCELLDISIENVTNNKKALALALDQVTCLMEAVRLKEKAAEEAKEEADKSGLDILAKVDELKQAQQFTKEANGMHAREVYAKKVVLAKELKELQAHVSGVLNVGGRYLEVFDKMRRDLEIRLAPPMSKKELADKEKLEKETLAQEALAFEESQMLKLVNESNRLKQESLQDFIKERESVFNILRGDVSDKYQNIKLFRELLDQSVLQLNGLLSSIQTSSTLSFSSSSLTSSLAPDELQLKTVESNETQKETAKNELLLKIQDLDLEKLERKGNGPFEVKNAPWLQTLLKCDSQRMLL